MTKKTKKRKTVKRTSRRKISKPRRATSIKRAKSTVISLELPKMWGPMCFNAHTINSRGFQAADLQPRYFAAYNKLIEEYGQALLIEPTGNPGITLSLKS